MSDSRDGVLGAVRAALGADTGGGPPDPALREERPGDLGGKKGQDLLDLFSHRLRDYEVRVLRAREEQVSARVRSALEENGLGSLILPSDLRESWLPQDLTDRVQVLVETRSSPISTDRLAQVDGVLTGCALAVAETGTLILDGGPCQGRRALSLLPDYHLCVVLSSQVVGGIPQALRAVRGRRGSVPRHLTFISGPSATSDIELVRVRGVHGPRTLEVLLVEDQEG